MIRILHMIGLLSVGGSQSMIMNLYRNIDRNKIQFDFIVDHKEQLYYADEVKKLGGHIYFLPQFKGVNVIEVVKAWNVFFTNYTEYRILHSHVRSYASIYLSVAKKHGVKTIIHSHSVSNGKGILAIAKIMLQYPLRYQADYYMACSDCAGRWLYGKRTEFDVMYIGMDVEKYQYDELKRQRIRNELKINSEFVVGHIGRMVEAKNHKFLVDIFLEILKENENAILLMVGDGELRENIEGKVKALGISEKIIWIGYKDNVEDYYCAMDVFVFPSLWEGLGLVLIEAQISGLPCFVSERISREADLGVGLFKTMNLSVSSKDWAEQICSVAVSERKSYKEAAKYAGYDIRQNADKMINVYNKLVL